jgi:hypothetical protein
LKIVSEYYANSKIINGGCLMKKVQEEFEKTYTGIDISKDLKGKYKMSDTQSFELGYKSANILPTTKACPECGGIGFIDNPDKAQFQEPCETCKGTGIIQIYYTPEDYKRIIGKDYPDDALVWAWFTAVSDFVLDFYSKCKSGLIIYIVQTAQPAPRKN